MKSLQVRTGAGVPRTLAAMLALYVRSTGNLLGATKAALDEIDTIALDVVVLHASPTSIARDATQAAAMIRAPPRRAHLDRRGPRRHRRSMAPR